MDEHIDSVRDQKNESSILKRLSFSLVMILSFLLPVFVIPSQTFSFFAGKSAVLLAITFLLLTAWLLERLKNKDFSFSKNLVIFSALLVPFSYLLSSLFSGSIKKTIVGFGFGVNSFSMIAILFLLMFLIARLFETKKQVIYLYTGLLFSSVLLLFFHTLRLIFGPNFMAMGVFNSTTSNLIGTWSELGIFFGLIAIISFLTTVFMKDKKVINIISYITLVVSVFFIALVNSLSVWIMLSLVLLFFIVYTLLTSRTPERKINKKALPMTSLILFAISLVFIFANGPVGGILSSSFNTFDYEVRPTIGGTFDIIQPTLANDPILGAGPNKFANQWAANKPLAVNNTQFWATDFNSGFSFILSSLVEVGILGFLAWLLFLGMLTFVGFKLLKLNRHNKFNHYISLSVFVSTVYLWIFSFIYVPGFVILSLSFIFSGVLLALCYQDGVVKIKSISSPRSLGKSAVLIVVSVAVLIAFAFNGYLFVKKAVASSRAQESLIVLNTENDINKSIELMVSAASMFNDDLYYRLLSEMDLLLLNSVMSQEDIDQETLQSQFEGVFQAAISDAGSALAIDNLNYQNWMTLGKVYSSVVSLKIEGMYDNAVGAYAEASKLSPSNPAVYLTVANLEAVNGDLEKAKEYATISLQLKNNYSDGFSFLSQIELNNENQEEATKIIEAWAQAVPNDPQPFLQLGFFKFNARGYTEAIPFLEKAVSLDQSSIDAAYLLGLSYEGAGEKEKAVNLFTLLSQALPEDENIKTILQNIQNGRDPLYGLNTQQEQQPIIPVAEQNPMENDLQDPNLVDNNNNLDGMVE